MYVVPIADVVCDTVRTVCVSVCTGGDEDDDWEQALIDEYIAMQEEQKQAQNSSNS